ncbi:winged helix-turn-helix domain-containing protein [Candidatus Nitrosopumilus sediminis]|nr:helix-turn-helix domain-containing protein [Candidatus Nitrosopumilus sediminis]
MDIFRAIMDHGPLTLYSANSKTRIPIGTIHRHFKQLSKSGKIRVYKSKDKGRKKIEYGPTMYGIVSFYKQDMEFAEKIENYYLIWIENKEFQKDLEGEGFDVSKDNLKKSKQVFRKYMNYFSAVEEQIEKIKNGEDSISRDMQVFFSSMMLSSNPKYQKLWTELYGELPGMQKSLEEYMDSMIKSYKEFKKNLK